MFDKIVHGAFMVCAAMNFGLKNLQNQCFFKCTPTEVSIMLIEYIKTFYIIDLHIFIFIS